MSLNSSAIPDLHRSCFFVGIDSDGCVFDTMETKHRQAFVPAICEVYSLEHIAPLVEEVWTGINLYSRKRGLNRFPALVATMDELRFHPVLRRFPGVLAAILPEMGTIRQWIEQTAILSEQSLEQEIARRRQLLGLIAQGRDELAEGLEDLERLLTWSRRVNELAGPVLDTVQAFKGAGNFLKMLRPDASTPDISTMVVVLSQSSSPLLHRQWENSGFHRHVDRIHGQEDGSKTNVLKRYVRDGGFAGQMLMIGDAPGDLEAAQALGASFYPILPRHEAESWERLAYESWPIFATGAYTAEYQNRLVNGFFQCLSDARREDQEQQRLPRPAQMRSTGQAVKG